MLFFSIQLHAQEHEVHLGHDRNSAMDSIATHHPGARAPGNFDTIHHLDYLDYHSGPYSGLIKVSLNPITNLTEIIMMSFQFAGVPEASAALEAMTSGPLKDPKSVLDMKLNMVNDQRSIGSVTFLRGNETVTFLQAKNSVVELVDTYDHFKENYSVSIPSPR